MPISHPNREDALPKPLPSRNQKPERNDQLWAMTLLSKCQEFPILTSWSVLFRMPDVFPVSGWAPFHKFRDPVPSSLQRDHPRWLWTAQSEFMVWGGVALQKEMEVGWSSSNHSWFSTSDRSAAINHSKESYDFPLKEDLTLPPMWSSPRREACSGCCYCLAQCMAAKPPPDLWLFPPSTIALSSGMATPPWNSSTPITESAPNLNSSSSRNSYNGGCTPGIRAFHPRWFGKMKTSTPGLGANSQVPQACIFLYAPAPEQMSDCRIKGAEAVTLRELRSSLGPSHYKRSQKFLRKKPGLTYPAAAVTLLNSFLDNFNASL